jgi:hypothetical protein
MPMALPSMQGIEAFNACGEALESTAEMRG